MQNVFVVLVRVAAELVTDTSIEVSAGVKVNSALRCDLRNTLSISGHRSAIFFRESEGARSLPRRRACSVACSSYKSLLPWL